MTGSFRDSNCILGKWQLIKCGWICWIWWKEEKPKTWWFSEPISGQIRLPGCRYLVLSIHSFSPTIANYCQPLPALLKHSAFLSSRQWEPLLWRPASWIPSEISIIIPPAREVKARAGHRARFLLVRAKTLVMETTCHRASLNSRRFMNFHEQSLSLSLLSSRSNNNCPNLTGK